MTQQDALLSYLLEGHKITPLEALDKFGCFRLGARIYDFKKRGFLIEDEMIEVSSGKKVKQYWLAKKESRTTALEEASDRQSVMRRATVAPVFTQLQLI